MNKYVKNFLLRGLIFAGFGPIVAGIIYYCISLSIADFVLTGKELLLGIFSTYLLAFIQAGASVFNQVESWSMGKSIFYHFLTLYIAYVACYLINTWIPFEFSVILIFTIIFVVSYLVIWLTVYLIVRNMSKKLNKNILSNG